MLRKVSTRYLLPAELNELKAQFKCETAEEVHKIEDEKMLQFKDIVREELKSGMLKCPINDSFLFPFLRVAKHDCDKALRKLKKFVSIKCDSTKILHSLDDNWTDNDKFKHTLHSKDVFELEKRSKNGCMVNYVLFGTGKDVQKIIEDVASSILVHCENVFVNPAYSICGQIYIIDVRDLSYTQVFQLLQNKRRNLLITCRDMFQRYPIKLKQIYLVHSKTFIRISLATVLKLVSQKIQNRFKVHSDFKSFIKEHGTDMIKLEKRNGYDTPVLSEEFWDDYQEALKLNASEIHASSEFLNSNRSE